ASSATAPQKPDSRTALAQAMPVIQGGRIIGSGSSVASSPRAGPRPRASSPATGTPTAAAHSAVVPPSSAVRRISVRTRADHTRPQVSGGASRSAESAATTGATHSSAIATSAAASPSRAGSERAAGRTMGVPYTARAHPVTEAIPMTARPTVALVLALALPLTASVARAQREPPGGQPAPAGGATGQDGAAARAGGDAADAPPATGAPSELPPIEAPPKISNIDAEKCKRSVKKLRNDNAKYRHAAEQEVIAFGRRNPLPRGGGHHEGRGDDGRDRQRPVRRGRRARPRPRRGAPHEPAHPAAALRRTQDRRHRPAGDARPPPATARRCRPPDAGRGRALARAQRPRGGPGRAHASLRRQLRRGLGRARPRRAAGHRQQGP